MTATVRPGSRLAAYEILAPLGAGGMGVLRRYFAGRSATIVSR